MLLLGKILELVTAAKKGDYVLDKEIGLTRGTIANWKLGRGNPSAENLEKFADYFNVSLDYLFGRTEYPRTLKEAPASAEAPKSEIQMLFDAMNANTQQQLIGIAQTLLSNLGVDLERLYA